MDRHALPDPRHFRMPAEWARHRGTVLTWPHRPGIWRGVHDEVEALFAQLAAELSEVEEVHLNVPDRVWRERAAALARAAGADDKQLIWHENDSDDVWARDHGPLFVAARADAPVGTSPLAMLDFAFNAWGGKFAAALDDQIPRKMNAFFGLPRIEPGLVMEGGSLEVNGQGDLLTTESVLLHTNRNPDHDRTAIADCLALHLGVERLHWLGGGLEGDDTDGHIDDMARFVDPRTIVVVCPQKGHPDYDVMAENLVRMQSFQTAGGGAFEVVTLPCPEPISFADEHLPASYANFYIANDKVLVPVFDQPGDAEALGILQALMPDRRVIGLDARALVTQYGGIHCVTQQIPA